MHRNCTKEKRIGAVIDFHLDEVDEMPGPAAVEWKRQRFAQAVFGSDEIVAASRPLTDGVTPAPGIYFLIWQGLICYVGQAQSIHARIVSHIEGEGRPVDRVATICGLPKWAQTELEYAYILGWTPSWNLETKRSGKLRKFLYLLEAVKSADNSLVMPVYAPRVAADSVALSWPQWKLQVMGRLQFLRDNGLPIN